MGCGAAEAPGLCFVCCYQPLYVNIVDFGLFCFINFPILPPPPPLGCETYSCADEPRRSCWLSPHDVPNARRSQPTLTGGKHRNSDRHFCPIIKAVLNKVFLFLLKLLLHNSLGTQFGIISLSQITAFGYSLIAIKSLLIMRSGG